MPEPLLWFCLFAGCFWGGVLLVALLSGSLGFGGGYMWSGLLGRRNARTLLDRMIHDETTRVAERARREDVEAAMSFAKRAGEMADLVLRAMEDEHGV